MSNALARSALALPLDTYAKANGLDKAVEWPNRVFEKPAAGPWIRFTVVDVTGKQLEMGNPPFNQSRVYGSLILQLFWPADGGDGAVMKLADALGKLYRQQILNFPDGPPPSGHVRMRDPVAKTVGRVDKFWQVNVVIPYQRDDVPT